MWEMFNSYSGMIYSTLICRVQVQFKDLTKVYWVMDVLHPSLDETLSEFSKNSLLATA